MTGVRRAFLSMVANIVYRRVLLTNNLEVAYNHDQSRSAAQYVQVQNIPTAHTEGDTSILAGSACW